MNKTKRQKLSSGDRVVDWLFRRVIEILKRKQTKVYLVKSVALGRGRKRQAVDGLLDELSKQDVIYINASRSQNRARDGMGQTLLHETLHIIFRNLRERPTFRLEKLLWSRLSRAQKQAIKRYLPKKIRRR